MPTHVSLAKLFAGDTKGSRGVATYYTKGITLREQAISQGTLNAMVVYYALAQHAEHGGPYARWFGEGIEKLGLTAGGEVSAKQMMNLLQLLDPNEGTRLPNNGGMKAKLTAIDATFSLPKELAAMWLLGDDAVRARIETIADLAMNESLAWLQEHGSVVRRGPGGIAHRSASGFIAIEVDHTTARPVDGKAAPHLHRHVVIINAAELDGKWTALDTTRLFDLQKTAAEIAGQMIRELTSAEFGITWERDHRGVPCVLGFDTGLKNRLSPRQNQIMEKALADGLNPTSRGDWVKAQRSSREGKNACGDDPNAAQPFLDMMTNEGISFASLMKTLHQKTSEVKENLEQVRADRKWLDSYSLANPCPTDRIGAEAWKNTVARKLATIHTLSTLHDRLVNDPLHTLADIPPAFDRLEAALAFSEPLTKNEIAHEAMMNVGRQRSVWRYKDLIAELTRSDISLKDATVYASAFLKSQDAAYIHGEEDDPTAQIRVSVASQERWATVETLEKEKEFVFAVERGLGALAPALTLAQTELVLIALKARSKTIEPGSDQYDMVIAALMGTNRIQLNDGQAGAGKSTIIEALSIAYSLGFLGEEIISNDPNVKYVRLVGCSLTANAAELLESESGIPSYSITMLLSRLARGTVVLVEGAFVVVDEMSQASTAQLHELRGYVEAANGRLSLLGNFRQLQSVDAGGLIPTILERVPQAVVFLDDTRRQVSHEERAVLASIHYRGELGLSKNKHGLDALQRLDVDQALIDVLVGGKLAAVREWYQANDRIIVHYTAEDAATAIANQYWDEVLKPGANPIAEAAIVMTRSNPEASMLNDAIITEAVNRGLLDPDDIVEFGRREFLRHQRVTLREVNWDLDVRNGQQGTVEDIKTVGTKWKVEYATPNPFGLSRTRKIHTKVGGSEAIRFSASQVAAERKSAAKYLKNCQEALDKSTSTTSGANAKGSQPGKYQAKVSKSLAEAQKWVAWANSLNAAGCTVPLAVTSSRRTKSEKRMIVLLDNGQERSLPMDYTEKHVDSGYAITKQRAQGQTVDVGIEYNDISYVGMSRGRLNNVAHLVIEPDDDYVIEKDRLDLGETYEWLEDQLTPVFAQALISTNARRSFVNRDPLAEEIGDHLSISMMTTTTAMMDRITREVVTSHQNLERSVVVVRSRDMAGDVNDAVVAELKREIEERGEKLFTPKIGEHRWAKGMPVVLARGEIEGLVHGATYIVADIMKDGLYLEKADGKRVHVDSREVAAHLDGGFAVTAARVIAGIGDVDKLVVEASGLDKAQLDAIVNTSAKVEVLVPDPDLTGALARQFRVNEVIMEHLVKDSGTGWESRSALDMIKWREGEEVGLGELQAEVRLTAREIDEMSSMTPRHVTLRDLEHELKVLHKRKAELTDRAKAIEVGDGPIDAARSLMEIEAELAKVTARYQAITSGLPDDDPVVAKEIASSVARHSKDVARMAEAEKRLKRFIQVRVTKAAKDPQPYHPPLDLTLPSKEAQDLRTASIAAIEEYRAKWGIVDVESSLGVEPEDFGMQRDEYLRVEAQLRRAQARHVTRSI